MSNWVNGIASATTVKQTTLIESLANAIAHSWRCGLIAPRTPSSDWCRHVYRERNKMADALANKAMDQQRSTAWALTDQLPRMQQLCAHFDGGKRGNTAAACGWHLQGSPGIARDGEPIWITLAWGSVLLDPMTTTVGAEWQGLVEATHASLSWAALGRVSFHNSREVFAALSCCDTDGLRSS